jgi:hypothetical protein
MCHPDAPARAEWDERDLATERHIAKHGWSVIGVGGDQDPPRWAYSIGLWHSLRSAELVMVGLDVRDMQSWINDVGAGFAAVPLW